MSKVFIIFSLIIIGFVILGGLYLNSTANNKDLFAGALKDPFSKGKSKIDSEVKLENYGPAPEFVGIHKWLNSDPLELANLKGKVVLVDFWTYSCINCIRTLPYLTAWYEKYKTQGLVVIGVHTPEFAFEKDTKNVQAALKRHEINYPVAQDNDYATWQAYQNRYWPAHYLVDQSGNIVYYHFGEGKYQETEQVIQQLLGLGQEAEMAEEQGGRQVKTPEIYFGLSRLEYFASAEAPSGTAQIYTFPKNLSPNRFALAGTWEFDSEKARLAKPGGRVKLRFSASEVNIVAQNHESGKVKIFLDGQFVDEIVVSESKLYNVIKRDESGEHVLELEIPDPDLEIFTFTFG